LKKIDIDSEVYQKLKELADPFVETSPNDVLRRVLGLPSVNAVERGSVLRANPEADAGPPVLTALRRSTAYVHPAFLTFLIGKHKSIGGGFSTADIIPFMERFHLVTHSGFYRNPWMEKPYGGEKQGKTSCEGSVEQYRQCRHYGCWGAGTARRTATPWTAATIPAIPIWKRAWVGTSVICEKGSSGSVKPPCPLIPSGRIMSM